MRVMAKITIPVESGSRAVKDGSIALTYGRGHYGYRASRVVVTRPVAMS